MNRNLRLLGIGFGIRTLGAALYNPFLALFLLNVMHLAYVEIGIIIAGVGVVLIPFSYLGGLITDRFGRRRLILLGLGAEALATAGLAYSFAVLSLAGAIACALAGGLVTTVAGPAYSAYIADFASGSERTRGYTFYRIGLNAGFSAGVTLGGVLITVIGFAGAVAVAAAIVGAGAGFLGLSLDPSPRDRELALDAGGQTDPSATVRPPRASLRQSLGRLARDRVAIELLVAVALAGLVTGQWAITFPLFVQHVLGVSYSLLGIGLALNGLVVVIGQSPTTESVIGRRHTSIAVLGTLFYVIAFLGLGAAGLLAFAPTLVFFVAVAVLTIGENLLAIPQATLPSNIAPPEEVGSYNGAFGAVAGGGFIVAVILGTFVLSLTANPFLVWLLLVTPSIPAVLLFADAGRRVPPEANRA